MNLRVNFLKHKNNKIVILNLLLFFTGFSIPFSYAFNSICIAVLFLYSFMWFKKSSYTLFFKRGFYVHVLFVIYFVIQLLGVFYSDSLNIGFAYLIQNIVFLILPIIFINLSKVLDYEKVKLVIYGFILSISIILLSIHVKIFFKIVTENLEFKSLLTKFVRINFINEGLIKIHPPYLGLLVVFSLVAMLNLIFFKNKILKNFIKSLIVIYFLISLYGISSFMAVVLVFLIFIVYILFSIKERKIKALLLIFVPILFLIIFIGNLNYRKVLNEFPGESLIGRVEWSFFKGKGDTSRPENWRSVLLVVKNNLLVGIGSDGGLNTLQEKRSKTSESFKNKHNAHNQYLETLLRHGIVGLLVYLLIIFILVSNAIKSKDVIFCTFIFIFAISCITESYLVRQIGLTFFTFYALLFSTFYSYNYHKKKPTNEKSFSS